MWTIERTAELMRLLGAGKSGGEIAAMWGVDRGAIYGKCQRLGISVNSDSPFKREHTQVRPAVKPRQPKPLAALAMIMAEPEPASAIPFIEAEGDQCRWFLDGHSGAMGLVCGRRQIAGRSYCAGHYLRSLHPELRPGAAAALSIVCDEVAA